MTELGSGPTGEVFFAEHGDGGERAAIKVLRTEACIDRPKVETVLDEVRAIGSLDHPGVARVLGTGWMGDRAWIATEVIDGETLEERLERAGPLEPREAAEIGACVAEAVGAAHELGFHLHRGLKPQNVFVHGLTVKVADFGVTALLQDIELPIEALLYASPEQCRGDGAIDHRTDVYSLGALLYHLLTGRPPFTADDAERLVVAQATQEPESPRRVRDTVPRWLERLVLRAIAKSPEERFQSVQAMAAALREGLAAPWDEEAITREEEPPTHEYVRPEAKDGSPTDQVEVPPESASEPEPTGKLKLYDSNPPPLEERERRAADKLSRVLVQRIVSGRLELPPTPEGVTAFVVLVTETQGAVDAIEALDSDDDLRAEVGDGWERSIALARLARDLASETDEVDPRWAYLAILLLAVARRVVANALPEAEQRLKEPDSQYVNRDVRQEVIEVCHREVAVSLSYAWQLPPSLAATFPAVGRDAAAALPLARVLTAAYESQTKA